MNTGTSNGYYEGFEGRLSSFWDVEMANSTYSGKISSKYARKGAKSCRVELRKTDPNVYGSKRAEISLPNEKPLEEHWYSFSTLLPRGGLEDYSTDSKSAEILAQWHNIPDQGEPWTSPPLALLTSNGHWFINRFWDDAKITSNEQMRQKGYYSTHDLGSYIGDKGTWVDWKFHIKWGWLKSQNPILEVYKNNKKVLDCNGLPNTTNDDMGVYMKLGIYKWDWTERKTASIINKRVVYYDEVIVN